MAREMAMAEAADDAASAKEEKAKKEAAHASVSHPLTHHPSTVFPTHCSNPKGHVPKTFSRLCPDSQ
jgi:hypothetical protein